MIAHSNPPCFVGRKWLFAEIDHWLAQGEDSRVFVITGPPGTGKSAIAAQLVAFDNGEVAAPTSLRHLSTGFLSAKHVCTRRRADTLDPHAFVESIASQLAARYPTFATALTARRFAGSSTTVNATALAGENFGVVAAINHLHVNASAADAFSVAVRQPLTTLLCDAATPRPIVLLIDGLDEAQSTHYLTTIPGLITPPDAIPLGVRVILTTRREPELLQPLLRWSSRPHIVSLTTGAAANESNSDITAYMNARLEQQRELRGRIQRAMPLERFISEVVDRSNFLYAKLLLDMLEGSTEEVGVNYLARLPETLEGFYDDYIDRIATTGALWRSLFAPVLAAIAVAQVPLSESQVARFSHVRERDVWNTLARASNLLIIGDGALRTYELFHQSFARYLFDAATDIAYRCSADDAHAAIIDAYKGKEAAWDRLDWASVDDYGLRFLPAHVIAGASNASDELTRLITPSFLRAKWKRFGSERTILADIRSASTAALDANDLVALLRWSAVEMGIRDQADVLATSELLPYYARTGQDDRAMELLDIAGNDQTLDADSLRAMLRTLGQREMLATGTAVIDRFCSERESVAARWNLAIGMARVNPAAALTIAPNTHGHESVEFCRLLAQQDEYVEAAINAANDDGRTLDAIACVVATRDTERAIAIAQTIRPYKIRLAGDDVHQTAQTVRSHVVAIIARRDPFVALALFETIADWREARGAAVAIAGALAERSVPDAVAFAERFARDAARTYTIKSSSGLRRVKMFDLSVAFVFAHISARVRAKDERKVVNRAWKRLRPNVTALYSDVQLLHTLDLEPLLLDDTARAIVREGFRLLQEQLLDSHEAIRIPQDAVVVLAAAMTPFDVDGAIEFARRAQVVFRSHATVSKNALLVISRTLTRYDPDRAIALAHTVGGYYTHLALVAVAQEIARFDLEKALEAIDGIGVQFVKTRAAVLGAISDEVDLSDDSVANKISSRLPRYADSASFAQMMERITAAIENERAHKQLDFARVERLTREERFPRDEDGNARIYEGLLRADILDTVRRGQFDAALEMIVSIPTEPGTTQWVEKGRATVVLADRIAGEVGPSAALAAARTIEDRYERSKALVRILSGLKNEDDLDLFHALFDAIRTVEAMFDRCETYIAAFEALRRLHAKPHVVAKLVSVLASLEHDEWFDVLPHAIRTICEIDSNALDRLGDELPRIAELLAL